MLLNSGPRLRSTSPLAGPSVDHGAIGSVGLAHGLVTRTAPPATGKYHNYLKKQIFQHWSTGLPIRGPCQPRAPPPRKCTANFFRPLPARAEKVRGDLAIGSDRSSGVPRIGINMLIGTLSGGGSGRLASVTSMSTRSASL